MKCFAFVVLLTLLVALGCQAPGPRSEGIGSWLGQIKKNPIAFSEDFEIISPPAALKILEEGGKTVDILLAELTSAKEKRYVVSLCAILDEMGFGEKLPKESLTDYLIHMIELESKTEPFPFCWSVHADRLIKEAGLAALPKVKAIMSEDSLEDVLYVKHKERWFTPRGSFLFYLVSYLERMERMDLVPGFLKVRYCVAKLIGASWGGDIQPLLDLGKPVVPELLEAVTRGLTDLDWVTEVLFGITFQYYENDNELLEENPPAFVKLWKKWWKKNQFKTRIEWAVEALESAQWRTRGAAIDHLRKTAQEEYGYDPERPARINAQSIAKWKLWWQNHKRMERYEWLFKKIKTLPVIERLDTIKPKKNLLQLLNLLGHAIPEVRVLAAEAFDEITREMMLEGVYVDYWSNEKPCVPKSSIRWRYAWWLRHRGRFPQQVLAPGVKESQVIRKFIAEVHADQELAEKNRETLQQTLKELSNK